MSVGSLVFQSTDRRPCCPSRATDHACGAAAARARIRVLRGLTADHRPRDRPRRRPGRCCGPRSRPRSSRSCRSDGRSTSPGWRALLPPPKGACDDARGGVVVAARAALLRPSPGLASSAPGRGAPAPRAALRRIVVTVGDMAADHARRICVERSPAGSSGAFGRRSWTEPLPLARNVSSIGSVVERRSRAWSGERPSSCAGSDPCRDGWRGPCLGGARRSARRGSSRAHRDDRRRCPGRRCRDAPPRSHR